jgi:uncharacterized peroxidase-related enzyme
MARIEPLTLEQTDGKTKELLEGVQKKFNRIPNIMGTFAQSPAVLEGYLTVSGLLGGGALSAGLREQIALAVGQQNSCDYCLAAHSAGGRAAGLNDDQIASARKGNPGNPKDAAAVTFARRVVESRAEVNDADVQALRDAGYSDQEIVEIIAVIVVNIFTNYFNHIVDTAVDFPAAKPLD